MTTFFTLILTVNLLIPLIKSTGLELKIQWKSDASINDVNDKLKDFCYLLNECFDEEILKSNPIEYPDDPMKICHEHFIPYLIENYDSGFLYDTVDDGKLVGFISNILLENDGFKWMNLFFVCVRKEARGKGIANKMIPDFIDEIIKIRSSEDKPLKYIGLGVDFDTPDYEKAFKLYSKLGFNTWWQGCEGFDYAEMDKQLEGMDPESVAIRNEEALREARRNNVTIFCMIKSINDYREVKVNKTAINLLLK